MQDKDQHKRAAFKKDFLWYFIGSIVPMMVGFVKTPIFTRYFDKESFGQLGLVTITFSFLGMIFFSWISSCLWRYYSKYEASGQLRSLYSNLFFLFSISMLLLSLITAGWFLNSGNSLIRELIAYSFIQLIFNQLFLGYMVVIRLTGKSMYYTIIQGVKSFLGLFTALILVFYFDWGIVALVSSLAFIDLCALIFLTVSNPAKLMFGLRDIKKSILIELLQYGSAGLILNLSLLSISYSDRYIIALFYDLDQVGVYDQVYKISQISILALIAIYFNTVNPVLLKRLESDFDGSLALTKSYLFIFIFFGLPIVFYLSLFSEELAWLLLGKDFRAGYILMPSIFMATFLHGLSNFFELRLKFSDRIKKLVMIALITALLNIVFNLILVSSFGYEWAAHTTVISYTVMILMLVYGDPKVLGIIKEKHKVLIELIVLLTIQYLVYVIFVDKMNVQNETRIGIGFIFALLFLIYFRKAISKMELPEN